MKILSICLLHYNQPAVLRHQLLRWKLYAEEVHNRVRFILIDDGSKPPLSTIDLNLSNLDIQIFRINQDIPWNIGGARNLCAHVASTKWILLQDMDVFLAPEDAIRVVSLCLKDKACRTIYKFGRINPATNRDRPHPGTMLLSRELYWRIGGCDEDFVGHYGFTDIHFFRQRVAAIPRIKVKTLSDIKLIEDDLGATNGLDRSIIRNQSLYEEKSQTQNWSTDYLRFSWFRIY